MQTDDLVSDLEMVLSNDPALDLSRMNMAKYLEERDPTLIIEHTGKRAKRFTIRALDVFEMAGVKAAASVPAMVIPAIQCGLVAAVLDDSTALRATQAVQANFGGGTVHRWAPADVQTLFRRIGWDAMVEIALLVIERAERGNADGGVQPYTPPPQSPRVLAESNRLRAERTRAESETKTSAAP